MTENELQSIVAEVLRRLTKRLGTYHSDSRLIAVFTGATVGFEEAIEQVRQLLLDGFQVRVVFSPAAEHILGGIVRRSLDGFPNVNFDLVRAWLSCLNEAHAVVVPMLSLSTVSKLASLIADNTASNILLHALCMGKPLVLARDGADPDGEGRDELGFHRANPVLKQAMRDRLQTAASYGAILTDACRLAETVRSVLTARAVPSDSPPPARPATFQGRILTAADVRTARQGRVELILDPAVRITPLARDMARQLGVSLRTTEH